MKSALAGLGLAGLLCQPCLLVGGVISLAVIGGALGAAAANPLVQTAGLILVGIAGVMYWRVRRRASCEGESHVGERDADPSIPASPRWR